MGISRDFFYALRTFAKAPRFPVLIVLTLILGFVGSTVMFGVLDAVLLHPIQAPAIDNVVTLGGASTAPGVNRWQWYGQAPSLEFTSMVTSGGANIYSPSEHFSARVAAASVTSDFFRAFGVTPQIGRDFVRKPAQSAEHEAVLGYDFWRTQFHSSAVVGTQIKINNVPATIIGVLPPGFRFPGRTDVWVSDNDQALIATLGYDAPFSTRGRMIARLRPGRDITTAQTEARILQTRIAALYKSEPGLPVQMAPLRDIYVESQRQLVFTMFFVSCMLLLVACANAGGLMMMRTLARRKEIAVRIALGGSRLNTLRLVLLECLLLSAVAGASGLLISVAIFSWIQRAFSHVEPSLLNLHFHVLTGIFAMGVVVLSTLILIVLSASQVSKDLVLEPLNECGHYSHGAIRSGLRRSLIFLQLCVTFLLVAGEISSFSRLDALLKQDYGFAPSQVVLANFVLPKKTYDTTDKVIQFQDSILATLFERLGGGAVAIASKAPMLNGGDGYLYLTANKHYGMARAVLIRGEYFQALHIPVLQEIIASPKESTVIVNRTFAQQMFPGKSALGRSIKIDGEDSKRRIVGVVGDVKMSSATEKPEAQMYLPYAHPAYGEVSQRTMTIVLDASGRSGVSIDAALKGLTRSMPPGMPLFDVKKGEFLVPDAMWQIRTRTNILMVLAIVTFLITGFGVYTLISYSVDLRADEFAVRRALGAPTSHMLQLVLRDGAMLTATAVLIGALLYGLTWKALGAVATNMPRLTMANVGATAILLFALTLLATLIPAWKAVGMRDFAVLRH